MIDAIGKRGVQENIREPRATRAGAARPAIATAARAAVAAAVCAVAGCASSGARDAGDTVEEAVMSDGHSHDSPPPSDGLDGLTADASDDATPGDVGPSDGSVVDGDGSTARPIHGCTSFIDRSAPSAMRSIAFRNFLYDPNCIEIVVGQSVRFVGDFVSHQLRAGIAISRTAIDPPGTTPNPIPATDTGAMRDVTFGSTGVFPYYCLDHEGTGMYGVVRVR